MINLLLYYLQLESIFPNLTKFSTGLKGYTSPSIHCSVFLFILVFGENDISE